MVKTIEENLKLELDKSFGVTDYSNGDHLSNDLGFCSLDTVDFIKWVEDIYKITIPDKKSEDLITLRDYIKYIDDNIICKCHTKAAIAECKIPCKKGGHNLNK